MSVTDPYEGTIYRDLYDAREAVDLANFFDGDVPPVRIVALSDMIKKIDIATRALYAAREKAMTEFRSLDDAQLAAIGFKAR